MATKKTLKEVSGLSLKMGNQYAAGDAVSFTASWTKVSTNNKANDLRVVWSVYYTKDSSVSTKTRTTNYDSQVGIRSTSSTFNLPFSWFDGDGEKVSKIRCTVYSEYQVKSGKKTIVKSSKSTYKERSFDAPYDPSCEITHDGTGKLTIKIKAPDDQSIGDNNKRVCTHVQYSVLKNNVVQEAVKNKRATDGIELNTNHTGSLSPKTPEKWTVRYRSIGIRANTAWKEATYYIAAPNEPLLKSISKINPDGTYHVSFDANYTVDHPVDSVEVKYTDVDQNDYSIIGWDSASSAGTTTVTRYITSNMTNSIGSVGVGKKRLMCVVSTHDNNKSYSEPKIAEWGKPENPSEVGFQNVGYPPIITWEMPQNLPDDVVINVFCDDSNTPVKLSGKNTRSYTFKEIKKNREDHTYGVYLTVGDDESNFIDSDIISFAGGIGAPEKPEDVVATEFKSFDGARVTWFNPEQKDETRLVDGCEVGYSEVANAWTTNKQPNVSTFESSYTSAISTVDIYDLEAGKTYYFWVRTFNYDENGEKKFSEWSEVSEACSMSDIPATPTLTLARSWITPDTPSFYATWDYYAAGGTPIRGSKLSVSQLDKELFSKTDLINGELEYEINLKDFTEPPKEGYITVDVTVSNDSGSTKTLQALCAVVSAPVPTLSSSSLVANENGLYTLTAPEPVFTVGGTGNKVLTIKAFQSVEHEGPDGRFTEFEGAVIYSREVENGAVTIDRNTPFLDNGSYRAYVIGTEELSGLTSSEDAAYIDFVVDWAEESKAVAPEGCTATIEKDEDGDVFALLTTVKPTGANDTDVCDIYRVTPDEVHLIAEGVAYGKQFADKYPPFSWDESSYRFCNRTDYGSVAWYDAEYSYQNGNLVIDFDNNVVEFKYNVNASDTRAKNVDIRTHMGGTKNAYFSRGIDRSVSISTVKFKFDDLADLYSLSRHEGTCFVRMPGGIAYVGSVNASVDTEFGSEVVSVKLDINEVSSDGEFMATDYDVPAVEEEPEVSGE